MKKGHIPPAHREHKARIAPLMIILVALLCGHAMTSPAATSWDGRPFGDRSHRLLASDTEAGSRSLERKGLPLADNASADRSTGSRKGGGGWSRTWQKLQQNPVISKIVDIANWVIAGLRVLWAIPKAIIQGDSRALIEAIGQLLSRASPETPATSAPPPESGGSNLPARGTPLLEGETAAPIPADD